jgi:serine/threonine-protein kinase
VWSHSGQELFYLGRENMMSVPIERGATWRSGNPVKLFDVQQYNLVSVSHSYDVSPDGKRFLMIKSGGGAGQAPATLSFVIVQHWREELKRLVPTK